MDNYYDHERGEWVTDADRYHAVATQERLEEIDEARGDDLARAWSLILALLADIPEDTVGYLGAGPIEDFVRDNAPTFITEIEREAKANARFRRALLEIWLPRGELPPEIESRVAAAAGPEFTFFGEGRPSR